MAWRNIGATFEFGYEEFKVKDGLRSGKFLEMLKYWYEMDSRPQLTFYKSHILISEANRPTESDKIVPRSTRQRMAHKIFQPDLKIAFQYDFSKYP